jgi:preprotein translocase subunit SecY
MQLLTAVIPALEKMAKEGKAGYEKINQFTRYGTVLLSVIQSYFIALWLENPARFEGLQIVMHPGWVSGYLRCSRLLPARYSLCGWASRSGKGNRQRYIPGDYRRYHFQNTHRDQPVVRFDFAVCRQPQADPAGYLAGHGRLAGSGSFRGYHDHPGRKEDPVQYARRIVGRKIYGGQSTYIPLKVDTSGVIAIIFAQSIILFPATLASFIPNPGFRGWQRV